MVNVMTSLYGMEHISILHSLYMQ